VAGVERGPKGVVWILRANRCRSPIVLDVVTCLETMEHLMSPYYALIEMRRVLKTGGKLICSVPILLEAT
jgi:hypothetical protein